MTCADPTRDEMLAYLSSIAASSFDDVDIEAAIYWFAANWHSGQWSNLYAALSASPYHPGLCERGPDDTAQILYDELEARYTQ